MKLKPLILILAVSIAALAQDANLTTAAISIAQAQQDYQALQTQLAQTAAINAACPTCLTTLAGMVSGQTGLVGIQLCCGPTTVPATPNAPPGTSIMYVTSESAPTPTPAAAAAENTAVVKP